MLRTVFERIGALADQEGDSEEDRLRHRLLILGGLLMSGGGLLWGTLSVIFGLVHESSVPFGYIGITAVNLLVLARFKNFAVARSVQISASLLLPFAFMWTLGGFQTSGSMMIWAVMSLIGSLTFDELRHNLRWLGMFIVLTVLSGFLEPHLSAPAAIKSATVSTTFSVLNMVVVNSVVFLLTLFFVRGRQRALEELAVRNTQLASSQQALIQSEKMAALGQLVAGVAHELNTPLGAIRASASTIIATSRYVLDEIPTFLGGAAPNDLAALSGWVTDCARGERPRTSREERAARRALVRSLDQEGIEDSQHAAELLVQMGITTVTPEGLDRLRAPRGSELLQRAHMITNVQRTGETIGLAADRASKIVFALKSYAHPGSASGEPTEASVCDNLETVVTLYHNLIKQGVEVVREYDDTGVVVARHDALNQVWTNLLHNALQAMQGEGHVLLRVRRETDRLLVEVEDDGPGIPAEVQARIFEPFFTTKAQGEGSGLGLSICHQIIAEHGGSIGVESAPGRTCFSVSLPLTPSAQETSR